MRFSLSNMNTGATATSKRTTAGSHQYPYRTRAEEASEG